MLNSTLKSILLGRNEGSPIIIPSSFFRWTSSRWYVRIIPRCGPFRSQFWVLNPRFWVFRILGSVWWIFRRKRKSLSRIIIWKEISCRISYRGQIHLITSISSKLRLARPGEISLAAKKQLIVEILGTPAAAKSRNIREIFSKFHRYAHLVTKEGW